MNLSHHKPTNYDWNEKYELTMGEEELRKYVDRVWISLLKLELGEHIDILKVVAPERYDLFIKIGCLFIEEMRAWNFEFNNEYTQIRHRYEDLEIQARFDKINKVLNERPLSPNQQ
jgi:hypothetical protein